MQPEAYSLAAAAEDRHWWFAGRRAVLAATLARFLPPDPARRILEVGCGNGGNLSLLARHGQVFACEQDEGARERAAGRGVATIEPGALPEDLPFGSERFDAIAILDVLEHVAGDEAALRRLRERLSSGGLLILTVPAYPSLWGPHDDLSRHERRYVRSGLRELLVRSGFEVLYLTYFNTVLFPVAALHILLSRLRTSAATRALSVPATLLNAVLGAMFRTERYLVPRTSLPFGLSLLAVARERRADCVGHDD